MLLTSKKAALEIIRQILITQHSVSNYQNIHMKIPNVYYIQTACL